MNHILSLESVINSENSEEDSEVNRGGTPSKIDLRNSHAIRRELASVYRDMRSGELNPQDGTKLAYVLDMLRKAYDSSVLLERIESVENIVKLRKVKNENKYL